MPGIWQVTAIALINYHHKPTMIQDSTAYYALRAEIDSLFASQMEPIRTIAMGNEYFYFLAILIFALLALILTGGLIFYRAFLSYGKDIKELARMKGDFVKLATLLQTDMLNRRKNNSEDTGMRTFNPTDTQVLVPQRELRRLRALERVYQDNTENLIEKKTNLLDEG